MERPVYSATSVGVSRRVDLVADGDSVCDDRGRRALLAICPTPILQELTYALAGAGGDFSGLAALQVSETQSK